MCLFFVFIWRTLFYVTSKVSADLYLFMVYVRILLVAQVMWHQVVEWSMNNELERIRKDAVV
jgi:hypothetical protein